MAIVNGVNYAKMYINEPKELGAAGLQHISEKIVADVIASAAASDKCFIGELPEGARPVSAQVVGAATAIALEDEDGNAIALGDVLASRVKLVAVPAAGLTNQVVLVKYVQC